MDFAGLVEGEKGLWSLFASAIISSTLAPGGSEGVLAYLVAKSGHSSATLLAVATLGNTLGAITTWLLGWWAGLRFSADQPGEPARHRAVMRMRRWGLPLLLLSWLPVVGDGFCFAAGWLRLSFSISVVFMALGKYLRYAFIVWALSG
ncbi:MAG: DedA family protein [Methylococcus sp.]|nr:MAG: DedA family protein [Methylococcus sp.]